MSFTVNKGGEHWSFLFDIWNDWRQDIELDLPEHEHSPHGYAKKVIQDGIALDIKVGDGEWTSITFEDEAALSFLATKYWRI